MVKRPDPRELARLCKVLSVDTRVRIVELLRDGPLCVGALAARLDVTQGAVSQHLRVLRDVGFVVPERRGLFIHYALSDDALATWRAAVEQLLGTEPAAEGKEKRSCVARSRGARSRKS